MKTDKTIEDGLKEITSCLAAPIINLTILKIQIVALLEYLASPAGKTDANCKAVDSFFSHDDSWTEKPIPDDFHDLLADMGGALHDTVSNPDIASNFDSTPEQLLTRANKLNTEQSHSATTS